MSAGTPEYPFWVTRRWWALTGQASIAMWTGTLLSFIGTVLVARRLGPEGYGPLILAVSTVVLVVTFLDFPLDEAVVHFGARAVADENLGGLLGLIKLSLRLDLALGFGVFALLFVGAPALASWVSRGPLDPLLIQLAALQALAWTVDGTTGAILLLTGRPHLRAWVVASSNLLRLGFVVAALQLGGPRSVLVAFAASALIGAIGQGYLAWRLGWRQWVSKATPAQTPVPVKRLAFFGLSSSMTTTVIAAKLAIVSVVLGTTVGAAEVGLLNVAMFPVTLAAVASGPIRMTMLPEHARLAAERKPSMLLGSVRAYTLISLGAGTVAAVIGWFLLPWLLPTLYGPRYSAAISPARVLLVAAVATLSVAWSKALPAAIGRPGFRLAMSVLELAMASVLVALLSAHGALGAGIAISIVSLGIGVLWLSITPRMLRAKLSRKE